MGIESPLGDKPVKVESSPTAGELKTQMDDLKARVEAAKQAKEKDVKQKLTEYESLVADQKQNDDLLNQANETLEYFTSMQELGQLQGEDVKKLEELKTLTASLGKQRIEIDEKISTISSRPEIQEKLYDAAKNEDVERDVKKIATETSRELEPRIDKMTIDIKTYTEDLTRNGENVKKNERAIEIVWQQIRAVVEKAENMVGEKSELPHLLEENLRTAKTISELNHLLVARRKALGMFKGKEKAAIDFVLASLPSFERDMTNASEGKDAMDKWQERSDIERTRIEKEYQDIISTAYEADGKIDVLTEGKYRSDTLTSHLIYRVQQKMEDFVGMKGIHDRWLQSGAGEGGGWYEATHNVSGGETYYRFYSMRQGDTKETKGKLVDGRYGHGNKPIIE